MVRVRGIPFGDEEVDKLVGLVGLVNKKPDADSKGDDESNEGEDVIDHRLVSPAESFVGLSRAFVKGVVDEGIDKGGGKSEVNVDEEGEDGKEVRGVEGKEVDVEHDVDLAQLVSLFICVQDVWCIAQMAFWFPGAF